jgi:hypothetical protein
MAPQQRAAAKAVAKAEATLQPTHESLDMAHDVRAQRGPGRPPKGVAGLEQVTQVVETARHEPQRLAGQRAQVPQSLRAIGHADHCVDLERGVRRHGKLIAGDIQLHINPIRTMAQHEHLREACLERLEQAERVVPTMPATIELVAGYVHQQVRPWDVAPPASYAMHAHLIPACSLDRVASTRTVTAGEPLHVLAERLRTPLFAPEGAFGTLSPGEQTMLQREAARLAGVFQRSSSNVAGRNGYLSLRNHQLRGLDHPRKRTCLTAIHHFFLTRADGTTAAERFFGQKPRSMFAAILAAVEIPPAPLSPPQHAVG